MGNYNSSLGKINLRQIDNFSLERLYDKGKNGIYITTLRNGYNKYTTVFEEDFSSSPKSLTGSAYKNQFGDAIFTNMKYSKDNGGKIEGIHGNFSIELNQLKPSERLPEFFGIFLRLGILFNDSEKFDEKDAMQTFDSNTDKFSMILKNSKYLEKNSNIEFFNKSNPNNRFIISLSNFFNSNIADSTYDGIITRETLINKKVIEDKNGGNILCAKINITTIGNYGFFIPLIQVAYSTPTNYP